ncbi:MAG: alpha/beta hydrolase [Solobacterium sp.]|nr:alpha/beta hydrolase [Solobacterium sp.]
MIKEEYRLNNGACLQEFKSISENGPLLVIAPGGGYYTLTDNEGTCVAEKFAEYGFRCFVLRYATADTQDPCGADVALNDMSAAVRMIRESDPAAPLFLLGFSAGGHLCASFANVWKQEETKYGLLCDTLKPAGTVLCYPALNFDRILHSYEDDELPDTIQNKITVFQKLVRKGLAGNEETEADLSKFDVIQKVNSDTPPSFMWGTEEDELIDPETLYQYQKALKKYGTECVLTLFEKGSHGLSLATKQSAYNEKMINDDVASWVEEAAQWMKGKTV